MNYKYLTSEFWGVISKNSTDKSLVMPQVHVMIFEMEKGDRDIYEGHGRLNKEQMLRGGVQVGLIKNMGIYCLRGK